MTRDKLAQFMRSLPNIDTPMPMNPDAMAETLLLELENSWDLLPKTTQAAMLGVATNLKRYGVDEAFTDLHSTASF
jgi:hypothetical protein